MRQVIAALALGLAAGGAFAQAKEIKIGVVYDLTGPLAAGGSNASYLGTKYAIDMINERGGVEGYKIKPIYADAQSKAEVAINEATRLIEQEKVDMLSGVFSSAHCVPMAQKADAAKRFFWANICVASNVFRDKNLKYVFRAQIHGDQLGHSSCHFLAEQAKAKLGKDPKDLKVAIIHEDGPYGAGVASGNESACKEHGIQIVMKEGYAATSPDLSPLVTKLKRARVDVMHAQPRCELDGGGQVRVVAPGVHDHLVTAGGEGAGGRERASARVVDQLRVDVAGAAEHG